MFINVHDFLRSNLWSSIKCLKLNADKPFIKIPKATNIANSILMCPNFRLPSSQFDPWFIWTEFRDVFDEGESKIQYGILGFKTYT